MEPSARRRKRISHSMKIPFYLSQPITPASICTPTRDLIEIKP